MRGREPDGRRELLEKIRALAVRICADHGIELFDLETVGEGSAKLMRVIIDGPQGVGVDDCAQVSRELSAALDVEDSFYGPYRLEVSSPGVNRPIRHSKDAEKLIGRLVQVQTHRPIGDRKRFFGRLKEVRRGSWVLDVDGKEYEIEDDQVEKAHMIFEFGKSRGR